MAHHISADILLDLRHLADQVFPIITRVEETIVTVNTLLSASRSRDQSSSTFTQGLLEAHKLRLEGYVANAALLAKRIAGITASVSLFHFIHTHVSSLL